MTTHALRKQVKDTICALHENFGRNIDEIGPDINILFDLIDFNSRIISESRTILLEFYCENDGQNKICDELLDEVFTDFSLAMYLCATGLIVPARMSVRRAFELCLASVYMWDLPHEYWGWRQCDEDLSFSKMVNHLNSVGYHAYLTHIHECDPGTSICDHERFQELYRNLSNTVHGKLNGLPPLSPERFVTEKNGINNHLKLIADVQEAVIRLLFRRFKGLEARIESIYPQIKR